MIVYIIPFLLTFLGLIRHEICGIRDAHSKILWSIIYIYLTCLIGFRYMVGGDSYFYALYFNKIPLDKGFNISWDGEYQPLFTILNLIAKVIYSNFLSFQIIHVLILNTTLFWFINKYTKNKFSVLFLCLLMFYINFTVEILRESLAIMVFLFSYKYLERKEYIKYFLGVIVAIMFHLSAIFLVLIPFISWLKFNRIYIVILIVTLFAINQFQFVFSLFQNVEQINKKIVDYSEASYGIKSTILFFIAKTVLPVGIFFWAKIKLKYTIQFESLMCFFGILGVCSIFNTIIFTRFSNYLMPFYCISLANVLLPFFKMKNFTVNRFLVYIFFIMVLLSSSYISFYWPTRYYEKWIPYYSIFDIEAASDKFIDRNY